MIHSMPYSPLTSPIKDVLSDLGGPTSARNAGKISGKNLAHPTERTKQERSRHLVPGPAGVARAVIFLPPRKGKGKEIRITKSLDWKKDTGLGTYQDSHLVTPGEGGGTFPGPNCAIPVQWKQ